jgi:Malate/L-lactate dehydrogenases
MTAKPISGMHFNYQDLVKSIYRVFRRLGAQRKRKNFSTTLTNAEFTGHPSHGFRRIKTYIPYIQQIQTKEINLNQKSKDTYKGNVDYVDGKWRFRTNSCI